jgi:uncharacterized protein (UPF0210 family)
MMNLQELVERYSDAAAEYGSAITDAERANVEMQGLEEAVREAIERRDAVMQQMAESLATTRSALKHIQQLCGQGLEVAGWHLNGSLEPLDGFFADVICDESVNEANAALAAYEATYGN